MDVNRDNIQEMLDRAGYCSEAEAAEIYRQCAELGDAEGQYLYGVALMDGEGCGPDEELGMEMICRALEQGHDSARWLATGWIEDDQVEEDAKPRFFRAFLRAAEMGHAGDMAMVGWMYENGFGVKSDPDAAEKWDRSAAQLGHGEAMHRIGLRAMKRQDFDTAVAWINSAIHAGCAEASATMAEMYRYGRGVERDADRAVDSYKKALKDGCRACERDLADLHFEIGRYDLAMPYYDSLMTVDAEVSYRLGWMHENGRGAVRNAENAMNHYTIAALFGHVEAAFALGKLYDCYSRDPGMARKYLKDAAEKGHAGAKEYLEKRLKNGGLR